jgi:hypothetical protein
MLRLSCAEGNQSGRGPTYVLRLNPGMQIHVFLSSPRPLRSLCVSPETTVGAAPVSFSALAWPPSMGAPWKHAAKLLIALQAQFAGFTRIFARHRASLLCGEGKGPSPENGVSHLITPDRCSHHLACSKMPSPRISVEKFTPGGTTTVVYSPSSIAGPSTTLPGRSPS